MSTPKKPAKLVQKIAEAIREAAIFGLKIHGLEDSNLADSATIKVKRGNLELWLVYYWQFVEKGRRLGLRKIPIRVILNWIRRKGLKAPGKTRNELAFAIQTSIYQNGIAPRPFVKQVANRAESDIFGIFGEYFETIIEVNLK